VIGVAPIGQFSISEPPDQLLVERQAPTTVEYQAILAGELTVLVEVGNFNLGALSLSIDGIAAWPISVLPISAFGPTEVYSYSPSTCYFSDCGYVSQAVDTPSVNLWDGRVSGWSFQRSISLSPESYTQGDQSGTIRLVNKDGSLDNLVRSNTVSAWPLRVLVGAPGDFYSRYTVIFAGVGDKWQNESLDEVSIDYADCSYLLDLPLQTNAYAGTGALAGGDAIAGQLVPLCFGQCLNCTPVLVDPVNLIYQIHDGPCESIGASGTTSQWGTVYSGFSPSVYDSGAALGFQADVATGVDLYSGSTNPGDYRTCLAAGLFQLGAVPAGQVTADVQGDNDPAYVDVPNGQPAYAHTIGQILIRALKKKLVLGNQFFQMASFQELDFEIPAVNGHDYMAGVYLVGANIPIVGESVLPSPTVFNPYSIAPVVSQYATDGSVTTARQFVDDRLKGIGGYWFFDRNQGLSVQRLHEPAPLDSVITLTDADIISCVEMPLPDAIYPPIWNRRVNYQTNNTVQSGAGLAAGVGAIARQFLAIAASCVQAQNSALTVQFPRAQNPPPVASDLMANADAAATCDLLLALHGRPRQMLTVVLRPIGLQIEMGMTVKIVFPRFGLQQGKWFRAFPTAEDLIARTVTLTCWG